jgi:nitroimidazol reductase NimA-like FMN-containing flavoprotein (pyridoxamine 5'-phosphate oxidase superfamily)
MSKTPLLRRSERALSEEEIAALLARARCLRVASVGADGWPYCLPLLYVTIDNCIFVHGTAARGHFRDNVEHSQKVCIEIDEPGDVFPYGRFECDTSISYSSLIGFGRARVVADDETKRRFCNALMAKYADPSWQRPKGVYPRLDAIAVYEIALERMTGKKIALPSSSQQWPAKDRTMSPEAK